MLQGSINTSEIVEVGCVNNMELISDMVVFEVMADAQWLEKLGFSREVGSNGHGVSESAPKNNVFWEQTTPHEIRIHYAMRCRFVRPEFRVAFADSPPDLNHGFFLVPGTSYIFDNAALAIIRNVCMTTPRLSSHPDGVQCVLQPMKYKGPFSSIDEDPRCTYTAHPLPHWTIVDGRDCASDIFEMGNSAEASLHCVVKASSCDLTPAFKRLGWVVARQCELDMKMSVLKREREILEGVVQAVEQFDVSKKHKLSTAE